MAKLITILESETFRIEGTRKELSEIYERLLEYDLIIDRFPNYLYITIPYLSNYGFVSVSNILQKIIYNENP